MRAKRDRTVTTYDRIAPQFSRAHLSPDFWRPEFNAFKRLVPGKKVIDIGCGTGRDAVLFTKARFDYVGIDASRSMLSVARKRARAGKFILMSFYDLKFPANTFDGFWAAASLLHISKKRIGRVLMAIRIILKPHGVGFIRVKEKTNLSEGFLKEEKWGGIERYFAFYTQTEFAAVLEKSGWRVIKSHTKRENDPDRTNWLCYFVKKES